MVSTIHVDAIHIWAASALSLSKQEWHNHFLTGTKPLQVHSFASDALELGEDLIMIGKLLGHRDLKSTARYCHLKKEPIQRAVKGIDLKISSALAATKLQS